MKKLANLKGAKALNKNEQKAINGGGWYCTTDLDCKHHIGGCFYCLSGFCFDPNPAGEPCEEF